MRNRDPSRFNGVLKMDVATSTHPSARRAARMSRLCMTALKDAHEYA